MLHAVIDRIVDRRHAVLLVGEDELERAVSLKTLEEALSDEEHAPLREGTWLKVRFEGDRLVEAVVDIGETKQRKERLDQKLQQLRQRGRRL